MNLSMREKVLLLTLAVVVIIFGGIKFLIVPAAQSLSNNKSLALQTQLKVTDAKMKVFQSQGMNKNLLDAYKKAVSASSSLLPSLDKPSINVWLLNTAKKSGLDVQALTLSDPSSVAAPTVDTYTKAASASTDTYAASVSTDEGNTTQTKSFDYTMKTYADKFLGKSETKTSTANKTDKTGEVLMSTATFKATGNYKSLLSFLDAVRGTKRCIIVSSINCTKQQNTFSADITVQFYAAEKLDKDSIFNWTIKTPSGKTDLMQ